jgi:predicted nucleotidyltransferase
MVKKKSMKKAHSKGIKPQKKINKKDLENFPSLKLRTEQEIAMDFATHTYKKFDKMVKAIILFGSSVKGDMTAGSDIDIIVLIDDASIRWDEELIVWYREELDKIVRGHPYRRNLHINTVKLTTWWEDLIKGDPVIINVIRNGISLIDFGGFFEPLKHLLIQGRIRSTPEAIYTSLQRAPYHLARSRAAEIGAIEGLYWAMVDSAHAALIAAHVSPPSPEHIPYHLKVNFVDNGKMKMKYVTWFRDLLVLHKRIAHGELKNMKGVEIDEWQDRTEEFIQESAKVVNELIS